MPNLELKQETYDRLTAHIIPFKDNTPDLLLMRILDRYEEVQIDPGGGRTTESNFEEEKIGPFIDQTDAKVYSPDNLPPLKFARLLNATFAGRRLTKPNWHELIIHAVLQVWERERDFDRVRYISRARIVRHEKNDQHHTYLKQCDCSIHHDSAPRAAMAIVRCARHLGCEAQFEFQWKNNSGAFKRGQRGQVVIEKSNF